MRHFEVVANLSLGVFERAVLDRELLGARLDQRIELNLASADLAGHVEEDAGQFAVLVARQRCVAQRRGDCGLGLATTSTARAARTIRPIGLARRWARNQLPSTSATRMATNPIRYSVR